LRGDDAVGPAFVARIEGATRAVCFDGGAAPENYLGLVVRQEPETVILVDAVDLGTQPGDYAVLSGEELSDCGLTTHTSSPGLLMAYLEHETAAHVYLLAIQPESLSFRRGLSAAVEKSLGHVVSFFT